MLKTFSDPRILPSITTLLAQKGIEEPTPFQQESIPLLLEHQGDFLGRSATGTGKTFAFGIPLVSKIDVSKGTIQAVVMVPTRELCQQVAEEMTQLGAGIEGLKVQAVYGGATLKSQIKQLSQGVQLVVATPGRLMDLIERKVIRLDDLKTVVFDEADELLQRGFQKDIDRILGNSKREYASWLFSASMPNEVSGLIQKHLNRDLKKVMLGEEGTTNTGIVHQAMIVPAEEKLNVLLHFLGKFSGQRGIIFCRTKSGVQKLYRQLSAQKFSSGAIHADLPQGIRDRVMDQFKQGQIRLLLATDVASRGVDIDDVQFVLQYHLPETSDSYLHRSGRTSRAGKTGTSITFVFPEEKLKLSLIKSDLKIDLEFLELPTHRDQLVNRAILWGRKVAKEKPLGDKLSDDEKETFKAQLLHLSKDEILDRLLAVYLREHN